MAKRRPKTSVPNVAQPSRLIQSDGFHPVKAEMSGATPKSQAKEPIQLDIIFVCQKREQDPREPMKPSLALEQTAALAQDKLNRLRGLGLALSQNDCRVTVVSQVVAVFNNW